MRMGYFFIFFSVCFIFIFFAQLFIGLFSPIDSYASFVCSRYSSSTSISSPGYKYLLVCGLSFLSHEGIFW